MNKYVRANGTLFLIALVCFGSSNGAVLPKGSQLEVRLLHGIGSGFSRVGDPLEAVTITPVVSEGSILLAAGATLSGIVDQLDRLGLGLRHTAASLNLRFTELHLSNGSTVPIHARVASVEEAREGVSDTGQIIGIHPTASLSTGVSGLFTLLCVGEPELRLPILGVKFLAARSPDAEITLPAGTEMLLRLTRDVELRRPTNQDAAVPLLDTPERAYVQHVLNSAPEQQSSLDGKHPSDLINLALIGTQQAVEQAFHAAGWSGTERRGIMAFYHMFHCMVQRAGYNRAAMSDLKWDGRSPDAAFQKTLDTIAKRHHVRLWHDRRDGIWFGAATEDVVYAMRALLLTHGTDHYVDNERAKVVNDLVFTGCVEQGALLPRPELKPVREDARSIVTDGDVAVLKLNSCETPEPMPPNVQERQRPRAARAALAIIDDIARSNPISVGYAMTKAILDASKTRAAKIAHEPFTYTRAIAILTSP